MKKYSFYIGVALFQLTLSISAQPVQNHLNEKAINTGLQGKPFDHYWSQCSKGEIKWNYSLKPWAIAHLKQIKE